MLASHRGVGIHCPTGKSLCVTGRTEMGQRRGSCPPASDPGRAAQPGDGRDPQPQPRWGEGKPAPAQHRFMSSYRLFLGKAGFVPTRLCQARAPADELGRMLRVPRGAGRMRKGRFHRLFRQAFSNGLCNGLKRRLFSPSYPELDLLLQRELQRESCFLWLSSSPCLT